MNRATQYSDTWEANGRTWREVSYWNGFGYQTFLQVRENGVWRGY